MQIERAPLNLGSSREWSNDEFNSFVETQQPNKAVDAAFDLAQLDTGLFLGARWMVTKEFEESGISKITPDEANRRYPDSPIPFREPINPYLAQMQYDRFKEQQEKQLAIARGPKDWFTQSKVMGAGILAHLMDPLEVAVSMGVGAGVGAVAARGAFGARVAAASAATAPLGARVAFQVGESLVGNVAENLLQEQAISSVLEAEGIREERDASEIATDVLYNSVAGTVVGLPVGKAIGKVVGSTINLGLRGIFKVAPELVTFMTRDAVSAVKDDITPNTKVFIENEVKRADVNMGDFGGVEYKYSQVAPGEAKKFYIPVREVVDDFKKGEIVPVGDDVGMGIHATDNPAVANARGGSFHEVDIADLKPLYMEQVLPDDIKQLFANDFADLGVKNADELLDNTSLKTVLESVKAMVDNDIIPQGYLDTIKQDFLNKGYNALLSDGKVEFGVERRPHNHVQILDENIINKKGTFTSNPEYVHSPKAELLDEAKNHREDFRNHSLHSPSNYQEVVKKVKEYVDTDAYSANKIKGEIDGALEDMKGLERLGLLTEADLKLVDDLKKSMQLSEDMHTLRKAAMICVGG